MVAATRSDPDLPLERLRLAGRLGELRAARPRVHAARGDRAAGAARPRAAARARRAAARADRGLGGRPAAGGPVAARREPTRDAFVADFAGDDRAVADYLTGEVLAGLPPATRELLLRTSIAERVCGGARRRADRRQRTARSLLEELERSGHCSSSRSTATAPGSATTACSPSCCAPACASSAPASSPSCTRAPPSGSPPRGTGARRSRTRSPPTAPARPRSCVAEHWRELLLDGAAPEAVIAAAERAQGDARLAVSAASACLTLGDTGRRRGRLAAVGDGDGDAAPARRAAAAPAPAATSARARELLDALLRDTRPRARRATRCARSRSSTTAPPSSSTAGSRRPPSSSRARRRSRSTASATGCCSAASGRSAALELAEGGLRRADAAARAALALAEPRGWHRTAPAAWAYAALAAVHWHRDELDDAERRADAGAAAAYAARETDAMIATRALRAHLAAVRGDLDRARGLLRAVARGAAGRRADRRPAGSRRSARRRGRRADPRARSTRPPTGSPAATRSPRCAASRACRRPTRGCTR